MCKKKIVLIFSLFIILLVLPFSVFAKDQTFNAQDVVTLNKDQVINQDYFAAGRTVNIDGTVNGDAFVAGGQINISGTINGDLLVAGGQITIGGNVAQNIRAAGGNILVQGNVGKNISLAGGNITVSRNAKISGNVVLAGGNGDLLSDKILGNVTAAIGMLNVAPDALISGNLEYWSNDKATIAPEAKILKSTTFHQTNFSKMNIAPNLEGAKNIFAGINTFFGITGFISSLILGIFLIWLFPIYSQKMVETITNKFWLSLLIGFITLVATPIAVVLLFITLIGIPFTVILLFAYGFAIYLSRLFVALAIGQVISKKANWRVNQIWAFVIGLVLYYLIGIIPIIGGLIKVVAIFAGVGAFVIQKKHYFVMLRNKKLI